MILDRLGQMNIESMSHSTVKWKAVLVLFLLHLEQSAGEESTTEALNSHTVIVRTVSTNAQELSGARSPHQANGLLWGEIVFGAW
jgi:hypothetical protein